MSHCGPVDNDPAEFTDTGVVASMSGAESDGPYPFVDLTVALRAAKCRLRWTETQDAFTAGVRERHARSWTQRKGLSPGERRRGLEELIRTKAAKVRPADVQACRDLNVDMVRRRLTALPPPPGRRSCVPVWSVLAKLAKDIDLRWDEPAAVLWAWWAVGTGCPRPVLADLFTVLYRAQGIAEPSGWDPPGNWKDKAGWWSGVLPWAAAGFSGFETTFLRSLPPDDPARPCEDQLTVMSALRGTVL